MPNGRLDALQLAMVGMAWGYASASKILFDVYESKPLMESSSTRHQAFWRGFLMMLDG